MNLSVQKSRHIKKSYFTQKCKFGLRDIGCYLDHGINDMCKVLTDNINNIAEKSRGIEEG